MLQAEYCNADRTTWKLILQDIKWTQHRKNSKQSGIAAIDSYFALFGARQYGATARESSDETYPRTLILLSPDPEPQHPQNHAIPPVFWGARVQVSNWCLAEKIKNWPKPTFPASRGLSRRCKNAGLSRRCKNERKERYLCRLPMRFLSGMRLRFLNNQWRFCHVRHNPRTGLHAKLQEMSRTPQSRKFEESEDVR